MCVGAWQPRRCTALPRRLSSITRTRCTSCAPTRRTTGGGRVPQGKTLLVVYCDDAMVRSDLDARQEMLKMHLNRQGEHVEAFSIKPARFDMKARHPFREDAQRAAIASSRPAAKPLIDHEAAERLRRQAQTGREQAPARIDSERFRRKRAAANFKKRQKCPLKLKTRL